MAVRASVSGRLAASAALLARSDSVAYLAAQAELHQRLVPDEMAELAGIADGFGLDAAALFALLHVPVLADMAASGPQGEGCTAIAIGAVLGKNRDVRPELASLQCLFAERDPASPVGAVLALGSLGAPGAYSSGMNTAGLALADTQVRTSDHGPGLSRYLLMNVLLRRARTTHEALDLIASYPHAGGGTLVLADRSGATAAVELRHSGPQIVRGDVSARTNHFVLAPETLSAAAHSPARLAAAIGALSAGLALQAVLATRRPVPLSWHLDDGDALVTISGAIYRTDTLTASIAFGPPDTTPWRCFTRDAGVAGGWREVVGRQPAPSSASA